jgi:hypothetical protein
MSIFINTFSRWCFSAHYYTLIPQSDYIIIASSSIGILDLAERLSNIVKYLYIDISDYDKDESLVYIPMHTHDVDSRQRIKVGFMF